MVGPMGDSDAEPPMGILQETPLSDPASSHTQDFQKYGDAFLQKLEKSRRLSKNGSVGPDMDNPHIRRRTSKLGLFGLFNRSKVSSDQETLQEKLESQWEGLISTEAPVIRDHSAAYMPPETDLLPIQESEDMPIDAKLQHQTSKSRLRNRHSFKRESRRESREPMPIPIPTSTWNAPPLFQVYPQSIKHSTLKAPLMSAEAILRLSKETNAVNGTNTTTYGEQSGSSDGKPQKERKLKKPTAMETLAKSEWVDKTYVLVTAGYLLQYAGQGTYDRVPEKILQLSEVSAAFASDAIPGKPFVLQVSQALNEDGAVETEISRSMFKKMGGLRADLRRAVSTLLLVFDSPEEMNEWLIAVRKEIEALGGKECNPEMPWDEPEDRIESMELPSPSSRYLVTRDPHQFSPKVPSPKSWEPPHGVSFGAKTIQEEKPQEVFKSPVPSVSNSHTMVTPNSRKSRYVSDTQDSIDQVHLDRLRESYASTAEGTNSTSRDSSPHRSVLLDQEFISEIRAKPLAKSSIYPETGQLSRQRLSESLRAERESLQPTPTPSSRPSSTALSSASGPALERIMLPEGAMSSAPNFSVPSFSKRYSTASASSPPSAKAQFPVATTDLQGPSVSEDEGIHLVADGGPSTLGQLQVSYKSSPGASARRSSPPPSTALLRTSPSSTHSHGTSPGSSDGERRYSRRYSSLEYARGVSPVKPSEHSRSPHPPPNVPLPPLPDSANSSKHTSLLPPATAPPNVPLPPLPISKLPSQPPPAPPPTCPLPPVPTERRSSSRTSTSATTRERSTIHSCSSTPLLASSTSLFPPPNTALPPVPTRALPTAFNEKRQSNSELRQSKRGSGRSGTNKPRPADVQAPEVPVTTPAPPPTNIDSKSARGHQATYPASNAVAPVVALEPSPPSSVVSPPPSIVSPPSPPKPTRAAPPPPPPLSATTDMPLQSFQSSVPSTLAQSPMLPTTEAPPRATSLPAIDAPQPAPSHPMFAAPQEALSPSSRDTPQQAAAPPRQYAPTASTSLPRPPTPPSVHPRKSIPRVGREPPPVYSPRVSSKPKASTFSAGPVDEAPPKTKFSITIPSLTTPTEDKSSKNKLSTTIAPLDERKEQLGGPYPSSSPHPFIPPIKLSHSREKGSFDGPWNAEYSQGPTRTMLDFGAA